MKLEVGMYVRTKRDGIGRIISLSIGEEDECCFIELSNRRTGIKEHNIVKASHTLLGNDKEPCLIEPGDYVNGYRVTEIETLPTKQKLVVVGYGYDADEISEKNIETIVTKEQFESMAYKVVEEC